MNEFGSGRSVLNWDNDPPLWGDGLVIQACRIAQRNLTRAEWERYIVHRNYPDRPGHATCPEYRRQQS
jgi:hypothetical protein